MLIIMADKLESMKEMLTNSLESAKAGYLGKIAIAQLPVFFGGIGKVRDEELERAVKMSQIGKVVDSGLLNKIPDWEIGVTSHVVSQFLMEKFGEETLSQWYKINSEYPATQDRRVVEVKAAIAEDLAKNKDNEKTA